MVTAIEESRVFASSALALRSYDLDCVPTPKLLALREEYQTYLNNLTSHTEREAKRLEFQSNLNDMGKSGAEIEQEDNDETENRFVNDFDLLCKSRNKAIPPSLTDLPPLIVDFRLPFKQVIYTKGANGIKEVKDSLRSIYEDKALVQEGRNLNRTVITPLCRVISTVLAELRIKGVNVPPDDNILTALANVMTHTSSVTHTHLRLAISKLCWDMRFDVIDHNKLEEVLDSFIELVSSPSVTVEILTSSEKELPIVIDAANQEFAKFLTTRDNLSARAFLSSINRAYGSSKVIAYSEHFGIPIYMLLFRKFNDTIGEQFRYQAQGVDLTDEAKEILPFMNTDISKDFLEIAKLIKKHSNGSDRKDITIKYCKAIVDIVLADK